MPEILTEIEARVVGALIEKQLTTPEYYPLTLNALVAACNQKTNREPVVFYTEQIVQKSLDDLREKNVAYVFYGSTSRVPKYKHILDKYCELDAPETAVVCVLLLRGAQTLGELRERTGRLYEFSGLGEVQETLDNIWRGATNRLLRNSNVSPDKKKFVTRIFCRAKSFKLNSRKNSSPLDKRKMNEQRNSKKIWKICVANLTCFDSRLKNLRNNLNKCVFGKFYRRGSIRLNFEPVPISDSTSTRPLCCSAISFTRESPSPVDSSSLSCPSRETR